MADNSGQIATNALAPQSATVENASASQHPIGAQIMADQYAAAAIARKKQGRGIFFSKLGNPGTVSDDGTSNIGGGNFNSGGLV